MTSRRLSDDELAVLYRTRLAWSGDPAPVLDHLAVFGPSPTDIAE